MIRNFCPYSGKFVSHVAAAVGLQSASSKKINVEKKWKQIQYSWKWAASGEECLWLINDEARSSIGNHHTSSYVIECTTFKLEGIKDQWKVHSAWTLHQGCAGKEGPKANWWSLTWEVAYATTEREDDSSEQWMPLLRRQGHTQTSNKLGGRIWNQFITSVCVFTWYCFDFPLMGKKKSETELTAGILKKKERNIKNTEG